MALTSSSHSTLLWMAVAAALIGLSACCSTSSDLSGLFTGSVPWGCAEPFACYVEYCGCLGSGSATSCTSFATNVTAATVNVCAARLVTCTLTAALNAPNATNSSCQSWGDDITTQYALLHNDRTNTNLTEACEADMCSLVTAGNSSLADAVNYTYVCSFVNFTFVAPPTTNETNTTTTDVCVATSRSYFTDSVPVGYCSGATSCVAAYCSCIGGTWNATAVDCNYPVTLPNSTAWGTCLSTVVGCLTGAALDIYVPGSSPYSIDVCVAWSVLIAEDYAAYYNATNKQSTELYKTCNYTACEQVYRNTGGNISGICSFTAVSGRVPTFQAYDACPYACPDGTCAASLATCTCTANAVISNLSATFDRDVSASVLTTNSLTADASASYGVSSGNCSTFDFSTFLHFNWKLFKADGTLVQTSNSSTLVVAPGTLSINATYMLNLTATGLLSAQSAKKSWSFVAVAPTPTVSITGNGAALRVSSSQSVTITATIVDVVSGGYGSWSCTTIDGNGTCPSLANATNTTLIIEAGSTAGVYRITYLYRSVYSSSLNLTIVSGVIPYLRIVVPSGALSASPLVYLNKQSVILSSVVAFAGNVTYSWSVNGGFSLSTTASLTLAASALTTTPLAAISSAPYSNTITVRATSTASSAVYGEATIVVIVVEPVTVSLSITSGAATSAQGLVDRLTFTPTTNPTLTTSTAPLGSALAYSLVYYDTVSGRSAAVGLVVTQSGSTFVATAPLYSDPGISWKTTTFGVTVRLNNIVAATGNATFNISKPNVATAAASQLALVSTVTDPVQAVSVAGSIRALMQQSTNATLTKQLAAAALSMLVSTITNASTLTSTQQATVFATITVALGTESTAAQKKVLSQQIQTILLTALKSANFDSSNAGLVLDTIGAMDPSTGGQTSVTLAQALTNDQTAAVGTITVVSISGYYVSAVRQTGAALAGLAVSSGGAAITLPSSFSFSGISDDAVYGIASVILSVNPYGSAAPTSSVVTFDVTSGGSAVAISGQSDSIAVALPSGSGACAYYDEDAGIWSNAGVTTGITASGFVCYSTHLTAFGSFAVSSSATVVLSTFVVLLLALAQLLLAQVP